MRILMFCLVLVVGLFAKVDLNTASVAQLQTLAGIGAKKAQAIVKYRKKHKFTKASDLMKVPGIGKKLYAKIQSKLSVKGSSKVSKATKKVSTKSTKAKKRVSKLKNKATKKTTNLKNNAKNKIKSFKK